MGNVCLMGVHLKKHLIMLWAFLAVSLIKLCLGQYSVGPAIYQGYNHPGSVHISGHMGPVRIIPVAAGSYQSHIPYHVVNHAPVYHVEPAPVAVHPMPVATYHADAPAVIPVHDEPVPHHVEPVIHPDDVEDYVVETHSHQRKHRNFALAVDLVPYEFKVPVLSMSMRKPTVSKRKGRNENQRNNENEERYPQNNENEEERNARFLPAKWNVDVDINDLKLTKTTNIHSKIDSEMPNANDKIHYGIQSGLSRLSSLLPRVKNSKKQPNYRAQPYHKTPSYADDHSRSYEDDHSRSYEEDQSYPYKDDHRSSYDYLQDVEYEDESRLPRNEEVGVHHGAAFQLKPKLCA